MSEAVELPSVVLDAIEDARTWVKDLTDDWVTVKKEILSLLPDEERTRFTRRDGRTKEVESLNEFELEIVRVWREKTGIKLVLRARAERVNRRRWNPPQG